MISQVHRCTPTIPVLLLAFAFAGCSNTSSENVTTQGIRADIRVVADATAAAITPELGDGYASALTNFGFVANGVVSTDEAVEALSHIGNGV